MNLLILVQYTVRTILYYRTCLHISDCYTLSAENLPDDNKLLCDDDVEQDVGRTVICCF